MTEMSSHEESCRGFGWATGSDCGRLFTDPVYAKVSTKEGNTRNGFLSLSLFSLFPALFAGGRTTAKWLDVSADYRGRDDVRYDSSQLSIDGRVTVDCSGSRRRCGIQSRHGLSHCTLEKRVHGFGGSKLTMDRDLKDYEFLEEQLTIHYAPENTFCYNVDPKTPPEFKRKFAKLAECLPNVVLNKSVSFGDREKTEFREN